MDKLVSILVPAYNVGEYLDKCLDSIVRQSYPHLQVVVVDDGSTDNTLAIAQGYSERYPFVEVYHQENAGVATARNELLTHIKGDYFLFIDADDWIELDMVEFLVATATAQSADIITCRWVSNDMAVSPDYTQTTWNKEEIIRRFLFHKELNGSLWNKLISTSLLHKARFRSDIYYGEDALFFWDIIQRAESLVCTTRQLYHYRANMQSLSRLSWSPERKGTGHLVWQTICDDTKTMWPQYLDIARARFGMEDMWGIYFASRCDYPYDEHIRMRQTNIRHCLSDMRKYKPDGFAKYIVAAIFSCWYGFGKILHKIV